MREIKFRQPIFNDDGSFRLWHYWGFFNKEFISPYSPLIDSQQFIGLPDKNGTKIYEGDIVRAQQWEGGKLVWISGQVNYDVQCCRWMIGTTAVSGTIDAHRHIMGNIYENPELLEG